jgi:hypothetical protein
MAVTPIASSAGYADNSTRGGNIAASGANTTTKSFTYTATTTGNAVLIYTSMIPGVTAPTTASLAATGWTFTQIGGVTNAGGSNGCAAIFRAYAPNTSAATITVTWNQAANGFFNDMIHEFSGADSTNFISASNTATGTGTPSVSVTPLDNDCLVVAFCNDSVTAVGTIGGSAATKGADDTQSDWAEYRLLSGGSGAAQSCTFTGSGTYIIGAVAINPAGTVYTQALPAWLCEFNTQRLA